MKKIVMFSLLSLVAAIILSCKEERWIGDKSNLRFSQTEVMMKSQKEDTVLVTSNYPIVLAYIQSHVDVTPVVVIRPNATLDTIYGGWLKVVKHDYEIKLMTTEDNTTGNERMYNVYIGSGVLGTIHARQPAQ